MRTPNQIAASRTNGARSRGPVTDEGKAISSRNGIRHGLLCRTVVLAEESEERFLDLVEAYKRDFRPRNSFEASLVETMAVARWRLLRIWAAQKTSLDRDMELQDQDLAPSVRVVSALKGTPDSSCPPDLLQRYEISLDRQFARAARLLMQYQSLPAPDAEPYHPDALPGHTWPEPSEQTEPQEPPSCTIDATEQIEAGALDQSPGMPGLNAAEPSDAVTPPAKTRTATRTQAASETPFSPPPICGTHVETLCRLQVIEKPRIIDPAGHRNL